MSAVASTSDLELLRAYEPVVRFSEGELFFPVAVEDYLACCELLERGAGSIRRRVAGRGEVTLERLAELGASRPGPGLYLRLVAEPFTRTQVTRWRHRPDRARFRHASRLARVGVLSRVVDALVRVSLLVRGRVERGTEAAAETLYREHMATDHHPWYGRVVRSGGYVALQYWFFYAFNDWRSRVHGVNDHEADWEQVVVYLAEQPDGSLQPAWVVFSAHDEVGDDLRRRWDDPDLTREGDHPVVYAGLGSHSGAYLPGEYLTTFDPPAFRRLIGAYRRIAAALLPWARTSMLGGVGIPYVDYARGDGVSIGPGQEREWAAVVIDDETPWVVDYQGLWGNDTEDPLGGERGPAGPRYERSGAVRQSWGDVVGWAGLAKVAPNPAVAEQLVRLRLDELDAEIAQVEADLSARRTALRADVASGIAVSRQHERALAELAATRTALHDERRRLQGRLANPPPPPGPHDHLRHRRLPAETETRARTRFLAVWSAVSTPLILGAIGAAFMPTRSVGLSGLLIVLPLLLLTVEAIARRHLTSFVLTMVAVVVLIAVGTTVAGLAVYFGWRVTVAICFGTVAVVLLVANLRELARD